MLRSLSLHLQGELETQLPLTREGDLIKADDVLDLSKYPLNFLNSLIQKLLTFFPPKLLVTAVLTWTAWIEVTRCWCSTVCCGIKMYFPVGVLAQTGETGEYQGEYQNFGIKYTGGTWLHRCHTLGGDCKWAKHDPKNYICVSFLNITLEVLLISQIFLNLY